MSAPLITEKSISIADRVYVCLTEFQRARKDLRNAHEDVRSKLLPYAFDDEIGRFRLWCGNIAAHRRGRSSLDYRVRDASHLKERVIQLLENLKTILDEARAILRGDRIPWEDLSDSDSDTYDTVDDPSPGDRSESTELQQLLLSVSEIVTCLMRISIAIRKPAPHDQLAFSAHVSTIHFEPFDIEHIRSKYPQAGDKLSARLGKAISSRRHYLRYREEHSKKLRQGLDAEYGLYDEAARTVAPSEDIQSTVASSLPGPFKESSAPTEFYEEEYDEDSQSQTSYGSFSSGPSRLRPPPLPTEGHDGNPFECPLCFRLITIKNTHSWYKHVYRDLRPYLCTFEDCETPYYQYESQHEWFRHELQVHWKWWECINGCNRPYNSYKELCKHIREAHPQWSSDNHIDDIARACERAPKMNIPATCVLCKEAVASLTQLRRHLGKHQEELALFALPANIDDDTNGRENDEDVASQSSRSTLSNLEPLPEEVVEIVCGGCQEKFTSKDRLADHQRDFHTQAAHPSSPDETTDDTQRQKRLSPAKMEQQMKDEAMTDSIEVITLAEVLPAVEARKKRDEDNLSELDNVILARNDERFSRKQMADVARISQETDAKLRAGILNVERMIAEAAKNRDEKLIAKLEKLVLVRRPVQLKREADGKAVEAEADALVAKEAAEKQAAAEAVSMLLEAARIAQKEAEAKTKKEFEDATAAHEKALAELKDAEEELEAVDEIPGD